MNKIAEGTQVLDFLSDEESLISGAVTSFFIHVNEGMLVVELSINLLYSKTFKSIVLQFSEVIEYAFNFNTNHSFYYIEDYKFLQKDNLFYLTLDPFDRGKEIHAQDNDVIKARQVCLFTK